MGGVGAFIGVIMGIALGLGLALMITVQMVKKSNDIGDSKGSLRDFGTYVNMLSVEDNLHKCRPSDRGKLLLENQKREALGELKRQ